MKLHLFFENTKIMIILANKKKLYRKYAGDRYKKNKLTLVLIQ